MEFGTVTRTLAAMLASLLVAGCGPKSPLEQTVDASSYLGFALWRSRAEPDLTLDQRRDFADALHELSLQITASQGATGSTGTDEVLRSQIGGKTVRQVLQLGFEVKENRLKADALALKGFIEANARLRPANPASADYLAQKRAEQVGRFRILNSELESAALKLDQLADRPHSSATIELQFPANAALENATFEAGELDAQPIRQDAASGR